MAKLFTHDELVIDRSKNNAFDMLDNSAKWWDAARALLEASQDKLYPGADFAPPIYFLALHCLECTLKSFLHARGVAEETLKHKFGHDLAWLLEKARELGIDRLISITPEIEHRVRWMAPHYGGKELQYFMGSPRFEWPLPAEVIADVGRIHDALSDEFLAHL